MNIARGELRCANKVAEARLELARANAHGILNPERLPIPPLGQLSGPFKQRERQPVNAIR
jgi:hypothetical protein